MRGDFLKEINLYEFIIMHCMPCKYDYLLFINFSKVIIE